MDFAFFARINFFVKLKIMLSFPVVMYDAFELWTIGSFEDVNGMKQIKL